MASLGAFLFGLDIGYIAPILDCASFKRDVAHMTNWADPTSQISGATAGFIVGIFSLGCMLTAAPTVSSYFLDEWGRRSSIMLGSAIFLVGCAIQAEAGSIQVMLLGRLITGGSIGLLSSVVPLYQAEMAPPEIRGALTSLYQLMISFGVFVAAFLDMFLVPNENGWRLAIWLQAIPASFILATMPFLPRSPRWLMQQGRKEEAEAVLLDLRSTPAEARRELREIEREREAEWARGEEEAIGADYSSHGHWSDLFTGRVGRLVAVGASLQALQQLVGMNAFMYFGPRIFDLIGLSPNVCQAMGNGINFAATLPALWLIDRAGRRALLAGGAAAMAGASFLLAALGLRLSSSGDPAGGALAAAMAATVFGFIASFACSWGPCVWVYCVEIFPLKHRARCVGITTLTNWVGNYIIAQFTPILLQALGFGTFIIFGGFCLVGLQLALWLPETKGVMLEQVGALFDERFGELEDQKVPMKVGSGLTYGSAGNHGMVDS